MEFLKNLLASIIIVLLWYFLLGHIAYRKSDAIEKTMKREGTLRTKDRLLETLFYRLPTRIGQDIAQRNPNQFNEYGLIVFEGEQGAGKTSSMVHYALQLKKRYPKAWLVSNMREKGAKVVRTPQAFLKLNNGIYGQIVQIDELGVWWNSKSSKYLDSSITQYVTTQRKNERIMLGTIQSFYMLSKDLRCQTKLLVSCICLFNCLNINIYRKPIFDDTGEVKKLKFKKIEWFLQTDELRNAYDTTEVIKTLDKYGMIEKKENN